MDQVSLEMYKRIYATILETRTNYKDISTEIEGILSKVATTIDADSGYIGLVSRARNKFLAHSIYCKDRDENPMDYRDKLNAGLHITEPQKSTTAWVINHEKPVLTQGPYEEYCQKNGIGRYKIRDSQSCLCVPLTYRCKYTGGTQELVVGVMEFEADLVDKFNSEHLYYTIEVAKIVGHMLWRSHRQQILNEISERIMKQQPFEDLLGYVLQKCMDSVYSDVGFIARYEANDTNYPREEMGLGKSESGMLYISRLSYSVDAVKELEIDISNPVPLYDPSRGGRIGVTWQAAKERKIQVYNKDTRANDEGIIPFIIPPDLGISTISIPLEIDGHLEGVVSLEIQEKKGRRNNYLYHYGSDDELFLKVLASKLAEAVKLHSEKGITFKSTEEEIRGAEQEIYKYLKYVEDKGNLFGNIFAKDKQIRDIIEKIEKSSSSDSTVLILGETGTGKSAIAKLIHAVNKRKEKPFEDINCSTLAPSLIESELFGHEKGAFTGATSLHKGLFERANGGTVFLDEIAELPYELQAKLLHAVENKEFKRVGGEKTIKVDVRVIAATNKDLEKAIADEKFRPDLYHRLNVLKFVIPPLRERREEILMFVAYFWKKYCTEMKKDIPGFTLSALNALKKYSWPGNIREVQNAIESAINITEAPSVITLDSLPDKIKQMGREQRSDISTRKIWREGNRFYDYEQFMRRFIEPFTKEYLEDALSQSNGNVAKTAQLIGVDRTTLARMLDRLEMQYRKG
jgi:transcriptional regulator with GAF, ATPase, and Fis domain